MSTVKLLLILSVSAAAWGATGPCLNPKTIDEWVQCRLDAVFAMAANQNNPTKQSSSPAIASSSTTLVDHTSLTDFASAALNVAGFGNSTSSSPSVTTTISAFTIASALSGNDPMDPSYYDQNAALRRLTFTVGTQNPTNSTTGGSSSTAASSSTSTQSTTTNSSKLVGASFLLINGRDLATGANKNERKGLAGSGADYTIALQNLELEIDQLLAGKKYDWQELANPNSNEVDSKTKEALAAIFKKYAKDYEKLKGTVDDTVATIQKKAQLSISGQALIGAGAMATSDYRGQLAFEKGLPRNFNFTANASFDYINSAKVGADTRGARVATDLQYIFKWKQTSAATADVKKSQVSLDVSGEGDWFQSYDPSYVGQVKLTIPIATGIDFPLSASYASKSTLLHEQHLVGKFGLTFDLGKITSALLKK